MFMRFRSGLPNFYGTEKRVLKLAVLYAPLIEVICNKTDRKNIEEIGSKRVRNEITRMGIKSWKKDKGNIYKEMYFRSMGFDPEKIDDKSLREAERIVKDEEERCRTIESLPKTVKNLSEISENMATPVEELKKYLKKARKDGVIERREDEKFQLTTKGLEVAYASFFMKEHGTGRFHSLSEDI
jgi:hypothetical protein